jgi:hypothetical protein
VVIDIPGLVAIFDTALTFMCCRERYSDARLKTGQMCSLGGALLRLIADQYAICPVPDVCALYVVLQQPRVMLAVRVVNIVLAGNSAGGCTGRAAPFKIELLLHLGHNLGVVVQHDVQQ